MHVPGLVSWRAFFDQKSPHFAVFALGPHHGHVRQRPVGDPHFFAVQDVPVSFFYRAGQHSAGIRAKLWFRQPKAADRFSIPQLRKPLFFLRVAAERVDRIHHERALHRYEAPQAGIPAFQFLSDQPIGNIGHSRAAVAGEVRAEKPQFAELRHQMHRKRGFAAVFFDDRQNFVVHKLSGRQPNQFFFVIQLRIKIDEIDTGKSGHEGFLGGSFLAMFAV